jgi:very-short-patch-repair endonuclease
MSQPEWLIWTCLRRNNLGQHWRRQHSEPPYILDFYCKLAKLAVEVDGAQHGWPERRRKDDERDRVLARRGIATLRVSAQEVMDNTDGVALMIKQAAQARMAGTS